jgi:hypothetical protein
LATFALFFKIQNHRPDGDKAICRAYWVVAIGLCAIVLATAKGGDN